MNIQEFKDFKEKPSKRTAIAFGVAITKQEAPIEDKRLKFREAFKIVGTNDKLEAIINMWAVASMLESKIPPAQKIQAVREVLQDKELSPSMIEQWTNLIYDLNRAPKDVLDFIAIDIRNMREISKELRKRLGHPNPEGPYSK